MSKLNRRLFLIAISILFLPGALAEDQSLLNSKNAGAGKNSPKLVSLAPSNTELLYSLGLGKNLMAVSEICDFPPEAKSKEKVGNLSSVKMEKIAKLKPDLILLVSGQESLANNLQKHGFKTLILDNSSIYNISKNLLQLGKVTGKEKPAAKLSSAFENSLKSLKALNSGDTRKQRIFVCVWPQPLMSAGKASFMNEGITIAGGINCTGDMPQAYPRINQEKLIIMQPDLILVPNEQAKEKFWTKSPWTAMTAVKSGKLMILPQHETDCLYRPTLRCIDALYWLSCQLHPSLKASLDGWKSRSSASLEL
ncbi:MAG: helical backbone metal receptor [Candidatus Obscuribacterales bacterium]|nr:helical backbone metal receptor [Candidatus Obscuribacterales bacterium]